MTTETYAFGADAAVAIIRGPEGINLLRADLHAVSHAYVWAYLIDPDFFSTVFSRQLDLGFLRVITDHRQRPIAARLAHEYPRAHFRSWSTNRTMHDKTIIFDQLHVAWLSTYNLTTGSWSMSYNRAARIQSPALISRLAQQFHDDWTNGRPVIPGNAD